MIYKFGWSVDGIVTRLNEWTDLDAIFFRFKADVIEMLFQNVFIAIPSVQPP